ncbi:MAG: hypothetical protein Q8K61_06615 [Gallionella sp.]|nr:hypothetical protein [Gallionella sp.]
MSALLLVGWMGYAYWQIRNLDPEGGCKEVKYFSLCSGAWIDAWVVGLPWHFQTLPSDEEMIGRFKMHRSDFEAMKNRAVKFDGGLVDRQWEKETGVYGGESVLLYPETPEEKVKHSAREWGYEFWVASTRYVTDSTTDDMTKLLWSKGYIYFKTPPQVEGEYLLDFPHEGYPQRRWRLSPSLNGPPWPSDLKSGHCWMRQIESQWFLSLCRDQFNGLGG